MPTIEYNLPSIGHGTVGLQGFEYAIYPTYVGYTDGASFEITPIDEIPESFALAMQEIELGLTVDFDEALETPPREDSI